MCHEKFLISKCLQLKMFTYLKDEDNFLNAVRVKSILIKENIRIALMRNRKINTYLGSFKFKINHILQ